MENGRIKEKKNRQEFEHNLPGPSDAPPPPLLYNSFLIIVVAKNTYTGRTDTFKHSGKVLKMNSNMSTVLKGIQVLANSVVHDYNQDKVHPDLHIL